MDNRYICVYDSGIGGLTTLKSILSFLPNENYIYYADDKNCPYGNKGREEVCELVEKNIEFLLSKYNIKLLVFACNTVTACCVEHFRRKFDFDIVGIEPAIKLAMENSKSKKILVLLTCATKRQQKYRKLINKIEGDVYSIGLDSLAENIENSFVKGCGLNLDSLIKKCEKVIKTDLNIDSLVLGCTHYSYIKQMLKEGLKINVYDGNVGVARRVENLLNKKEMFCGVRHGKGDVLLSSRNKLKIKRYKEILNNIKII